MTFKTVLIQSTLAGKIWRQLTCNTWKRNTNQGDSSKFTMKDHCTRQLQHSSTGSTSSNREVLLDGFPQSFRKEGAARRRMSQLPTQGCCSKNPETFWTIQVQYLEYFEAFRRFLIHFEGFWCILKNSDAFWKPLKNSEQSGWIFTTP